MLKAFFNIWRIAELRGKLLFTIGMLAIYRIGFFIPLPGIKQEALAEFFKNLQGSAAGNIATFVGMFTGGMLSQSTIFGLGIMPYISAAIIMQLLSSVYEPLKKVQNEGPAGRQKIQEYTRYLTVAICLMQAVMYMSFLQSQTNPYLVHADWRGTIMFWSCGIVGLTAGSVFLMWLGEQIDKYGIGNGVSLIITAGIIAGMPTAIGMVASNFSLSGGSEGSYTVGHVVFLVIAFICVVAGAIVITQGQRRIPIQQAKHTRGRRVYGGQKSYLPLRVNHGGVMPIIFASSLMMFPSLIIGWIASWTEGDSAVVNFLNRNLAMDGFLYLLIYIAMIYFFAYFWTTVQFQPTEMAKQLRDHGSFVPGLRPGPRTAEYLEAVMERITYVGAGFLAVIAVIPTIVAAAAKIPFQVSAFLGGTGLLIVVSVMLDFVQRIEASLLMRNYEGFLGGSGGAGGGTKRGPRIRGPRG